MAGSAALNSTAFTAISIELKQYIPSKDQQHLRLHSSDGRCKNFIVTYDDDKVATKIKHLQPFKFFFCCVHTEDNHDLKRQILASVNHPFDHESLPQVETETVVPLHRPLTNEAWWKRFDLKTSDQNPPLTLIVNFEDVIISNYFIEKSFEQYLQLESGEEVYVYKALINDLTLFCARGHKLKLVSSEAFSYEFVSALLYDYGLAIAKNCYFDKDNEHRLQGETDVAFIERMSFTTRTMYMAKSSSDRPRNVLFYGVSKSLEV